MKSEQMVECKKEGRVKKTERQMDRESEVRHRIVGKEIWKAKRVEKVKQRHRSELERVKVRKNGGKEIKKRDRVSEQSKSEKGTKSEVLKIS